MTYDDVRNAIVSTLQADAGLKALTVDIRTHRGRFTIDDLKTVSAKPLTILISMLAIKKAELRSGQVDCNCVWGAYVVTVDKPGSSRDAGALIMMTRLMMVIPGNDWGLDLSAPEEIEGMNLYAAKEDGKGVAIWAVTWEQVVSLELTDIDSLDDFLKAHADWDVADPDGAYEASDDVILAGTAPAE